MNVTQDVKKSLQFFNSFLDLTLLCDHVYANYASNIYINVSVDWYILLNITKVISHFS